MITIKLEEPQYKNLLIFLGRSNLNVSEIPALLELQRILYDAQSSAVEVAEQE